MAKVNPFLSMTALNVNELNFPPKDIVVEWIIKHLQETHFILKDTHDTHIAGKVEEWKNSIPCKY